MALQNTHKLKGLAISLLTVCCLGSAKAEDSLYIVGPGDTLWRIANEQMHNGEDWRRLAEYNKLSEQSTLKVGQALKIPTEWLKDLSEQDSGPAASSAPAPKEAVVAQATASNSAAASAVDATVVDVLYGRLSAHNGKNRSKLTPGSLLTEDSVISTSKDSSANIKLKNGAMVVMLPNSTIKTSNPVEVIKGRIEYQASLANDQALVSTSAATINGQKARFRITAADEGKHTQVEVISGGVTVNSGEHSRSVSAGIAINVKSGEALPEPRQGLLRPDLTNMPKRSVNGDVNLKWSEINNADAYRAQLVSAGKDYVVIRDKHLKQPAIQWSDISPGVYTIRLRSIDKNGLEGLDAELPFKVLEPIKAPMPQTPVDGITLNTNKPWIAWSRIPEANNYVLQVSQDKNFEKDVEEYTHLVNTYYRYSEALPAGEYFWRVKSVASRKVQSGFSNPRSFSITE